MKNSSAIFIAIGVLVLLAAIFFFNKSANPEPAVTATPTGQQSTTASSEASPIPSPTPSVAELIINVPADLTLTAQTLRVKEGEKATIKVTSQVADEVHLHGYDLSQAVGPGTPAQIDLTADKTGRFEIELEERGKAIGILEVYPK
ncbi:MAG TPA: hypothetical protein VGE59_04365 [Patescibacteria group bacterium]